MMLKRLSTAAKQRPLIALTVVGFFWWQWKGNDLDGQP